MRERVVQLGIGETERVMRVRQRDKRRLTTGELEQRRTFVDIHHSHRPFYQTGLGSDFCAARVARYQADFA